MHGTEMKARHKRLTDRQRAIAESNIPLVWKLAMSRKTYRLDLDEKVQEGYLGLAIATKKFRKNRKRAFGTLAGVCILNEIKLAEYAATLIHVPHDAQAYGLKTAKNAAKAKNALSPSGLAGISVDRLGSDSPEDSVERQEAAEAVRKALSELDPIERAVVVGVINDGESLESLGARHGISKTTAQNRKMRAYEKLRLKLAAYA